VTVRTHAPHPREVIMGAACAPAVTPLCHCTACLAKDPLYWYNALEYRKRAAASYPAVVHSKRVSLK